MRVLVPLVLLAACSAPQNEVKKPTPPDMSALIDSFTTPTADLNQQTASELAAPAHELSTSIAQLGLDQDIVAGVLDAIAARQQDQQTTSAGVATRREGVITDQGYMQVTRICNGWGAMPIPDPANGNMQLTVGFENATIDPIVWGSFTLCRYVADGNQLQIAGNAGAASGPINCSFGAAVPWDQVGRVPMLLSVDFGVLLNGAPRSLQSAFQLDPVAQTIELLEATSQGTLLVLMSSSTPSATGILSVRAKNGTFNCDESARTCTSQARMTVTF